MDGKGSSIGLLSMLGLIFIVLKLVEVITWSWVWVLAPFWIPIAVLSLGLLMWLAILGITKKK